MFRPDIIAVFIPIVTLLVFGFIIKVLSDNKTRRSAIEKGMLSEDLKYLYYDRYERNIPSSLKWGFVLIGIGLAVFIGQLGPEEMVNEITFGSMFLLAGLGLILYYFIGLKLMKKNEEKN